jgi:hypothetical protein
MDMDIRSSHSENVDERAQATITTRTSSLLFLGIIGGVVALVAVFQPSLGEGSLAIERTFAVIAAIVMGALIVTHCCRP